MAWEVERTNEFAGWFGDLSDEEQVSVGRVVTMQELNREGLI
jgi:hypothetical protein